MADLQKSKAKFKVRVVADIVQTVLAEEEVKLSCVIERFPDRTLGTRKIVVQEFLAVAKRRSKVPDFTDLKLLNGSIRTIATKFLRFKNL